MGLLINCQAGGDDKERDDQRYFGDHACAQNADLNRAVEFERDAHQRISCQAADEDADDGHG